MAEGFQVLVREKVKEKQWQPGQHHRQLHATHAAASPESEARSIILSRPASALCTDFFGVGIFLFKAGRFSGVAAKDSSEEEEDSLALHWNGSFRFLRTDCMRAQATVIPSKNLVITNARPAQCCWMHVPLQLQQRCLCETAATFSGIL